ncbi:hypothetical protein SPLC1_S102800 [Arthrospira platensis C1]|nr:hypothetical protein SPLC1_S102800 [Arthrospira platensis C1]RAQ41494.1 hypothetical protein B9S53_13575 [Arthrospira sp. O9.13F]
MDLMAVTQIFLGLNCLRTVSRIYLMTHRGLCSLFFLSPSPCRLGATQQRSRLGEAVGWVQPNKGVGWVKL